MKYLLLTALIIEPILSSCSIQPTLPSTPQSTVENLMKDIQNKDLSAVAEYSCFKETVDRNNFLKTIPSGVQKWTITSVEKHIDTKDPDNNSSDVFVRIEYLLPNNIPITRTFTLNVLTPDEAYGSIVRFIDKSDQIIAHVDATLGRPHKTISFPNRKNYSNKPFCTYGFFLEHI